ncbi:hypothetical protein INR49_020881 [Caranx melampygus]|nr:hypothetical protein INR49_020881 [Caranx melampygus]
MQRLQERRGRRPGGRGRRGGAKRCLSSEVQQADRKKTQNHREEGKSYEVQDLVFSENKRNRVRGNKQEKRDGALQKIGELLHSSPPSWAPKAQGEGLRPGVLGFLGNSGQMVAAVAVSNPDHSGEDECTCQQGRATEEERGSVSSCEINEPTCQSEKR